MSVRSVKKGGRLAKLAALRSKKKAASARAAKKAASAAKAAAKASMKAAKKASDSVEQAKAIARAKELGIDVTSLELHEAWLEVVDNTSKTDYFLAAISVKKKKGKGGGTKSLDLREKGVGGYRKLVSSVRNIYFSHQYSYYFTLFCE